MLSTPRLRSSRLSSDIHKIHMVLRIHIIKSRLRMRSVLRGVYITLWIQRYSDFEHLRYDRQDETDAWLKAGNDNLGEGERLLLWHGSRTTNFAGMMMSSSHGCRLAQMLSVVRYSKAGLANCTTRRYAFSDDNVV